MFFSETSENPRVSGLNRKLPSQLVSSYSDPCLNLDADKKLKKRVWFSPDVPDVCKCSKDYRHLTIAVIAQRMKKAWTPKKDPCEREREREREKKKKKKNGGGGGGGGGTKKKRKEKANVC